MSANSPGQFLELHRMHRFLAIFLLALLTLRPAQAYIDLGSGSYILQIVLAFLFGSLFYVKSAWQRFVGLFRRKRDSSK
jgi:hypothetical protein